MNVEQIVGNCDDEQLKELVGYALAMMREDTAYEVIVDWARADETRADELIATLEG